MECGINDAKTHHGRDLHRPTGFSGDFRAIFRLLDSAHVIVGLPPPAPPAIVFFSNKKANFELWHRALPKSVPISKKIITHFWECLGEWGSVCSTVCQTVARVRTGRSVPSKGKCIWESDRQKRTKIALKTKPSWEGASNTTTFERACGKSTGSLWEVYGKPARSLWEACEKPMGSLWEVYGKPVGSL